MDSQPAHNQTTFAGQEVTYVTARLIMILAVGVYLLTSTLESIQTILAWVLLSGMGIHLGVYWWLASTHKVNLKDLNRLSFFLDVAVISIFCLATGGLFSPFYVLYYFTISFAAITLPLGEVLIFSFLATFLG